MTLKIMWNMDPMGRSVSAQITSIGNAWEINEWLLGYLGIEYQICILKLLLFVANEL